MAETLDSNFSTGIRLLESALWEKAYFYGGKRVASFISEDREHLQNVEYFLHPIHFSTEGYGDSLILFGSDAFFYQSLAYCLQELHKVGALKDLNNSYRIEVHTRKDSGEVFHSVLPLSGGQYYRLQTEGQGGLLGRFTIMERSLISLNESVGYTPEFLKILARKRSLNLLELAMIYATNYHKSVFGIDSVQTLDDSLEDLTYFGEEDSLGFFLGIDSPKSVWVKEFFQVGSMALPVRHSLVHEAAQSVARSVRNNNRLLSSVFSFLERIERYLATKKDSR